MLLAQPHDEALPVVRVSMVIRMNPGPGWINESPSLQAPGNAESAPRAQDHGDVSRPLRDLLRP